MVHIDHKDDDHERNALCRETFCTTHN